MRRKSETARENAWMAEFGTGELDEGAHQVDSVQKCLDHLQAVSFFLVGLNTIFMGVMVDINMSYREVNQDPPVWPSIVDYIFTGIFCVEMLMRLCLEKLRFFIGANAPWNIFDLIIVLFQLFESLHQFGSTSYLRIFRLLRVIRVSRMIRTLRSLRAFRLILHVESWRPLLWGCVIMVAFMYLFALVITSAVGDWISDQDGELPPRMLDLYGSVARTMATLFMSITGGEPWDSLVLPLKSMSWIWHWAFLAYVFIMIIGLFNKVSALYVDGLLHVSALDRAVVMGHHSMGERSKLMEMKELLQKDNYNNKISYRNLMKVLRDAQGSKGLRSIGLDVYVAKALFRLLDTEDRDSVDVDEYIDSLRNISGNATNMHQATIVYQNKRMLLRINRLEQHLQELLSLQIPRAESARYSELFFSQGGGSVK
jgi:hypothetical protein